MGMMRAIGLMSGTSLDGVDVALLETDGETIASLGPTGYRPYTDTERTLLRQALRDAAALDDRDQRPGALSEAERLVTRAHAEAVEGFLADNRLEARDVDVVGFHGQTVLHRPARRLTVQLGDGDSLADRLGVTVVYDFRAADLAAGGQGAPLVPVFHRAMAKACTRPQPLAVLNIGGVANVTIVDGDREPVACDTGPGNALIDDFMHARTGARFDADGAAARAGRVDMAFVERVLAQEFFARPCPKSLDRNEFVVDMSSYGTADGAATLAALTASAVARLVRHLPAPPRAWLVAGGGARNPVLMEMLAGQLAPASVEPASAVGWSVEGLEAQAFAFLAVRSLGGLPLTFPATTGAPRPLTGGRVASPDRRKLAV